MRLILIDNGTGYVWGDTADIGGRVLSLTGSAEECAVAAARAVDEDFGAHGRSYEFRLTAPRDTGTGYHVYRADIGGSEAVPVVHDGQDREIIDAVQRDCDFIGYVECSDADA